MAVLGFTYEIDRCTGCKACQIACKDRADLQGGSFFRRVELVKDESGFYYYSGACNHCENPGCMNACPTKALYRAEDGTVQHFAGKCIGCGSCVRACPYGAPKLSVSMGISRKCDTCADLRASGLTPACVRACITHCLHFGELPEMREDTNFWDAPAFLPNPEKTQPSLRILRGAEKEDAGGAPVPECDKTPILEHGRAPVSECDKTPISESGKMQDVFPVGRNVESRESKHIVIVGNGIAGLSAALEARERDPHCRISLIGAENALTYSRPMLTKTALRGFDPGRFTVFDRAWYEAKRIDLLLGRRVTTLDPGTKTLAFSDGESFEYDRCVLALGASCLIPPIPGRDQERVYGIRDIESILNIRSAMASARRVVIVGGGVIGMEMAWELKRAGCALTVLELAPVLMGRFLDEEFSRLLKERLCASGIDVRIGVRIEAISGKGRADGVRLADGTIFEADMVIISCGIRPNTDLAASAGCVVNRGIVVNAGMETNVRDIYACGDCAELPGFIPGVWTAAEAQGKIAGAGAAGANLAYAPEPSGVLINGFGAFLFALGDTGKDPDLEYETLEFDDADTTGAFFLVNDDKRSFLGKEKYYFAKGCLTGGILTGNSAVPEILKKGVMQRMRKDEFLKNRRGAG